MTFVRGEIRFALTPSVLTPSGEIVDAYLERRPGRPPLLILGTGLIDRLELLEDLYRAGAISGAPACWLCGCTDMAGCEDGCYWVASDLCSRCKPLAGTWQVVPAVGALGGPGVPP